MATELNDPVGEIVIDMTPGRFDRERGRAHGRVLGESEGMGKKV